MRFVKCNIAIFAMLLLAATAAAQSFSPGGPLIVHDANGKIVGQVLQFAGEYAYVSVVANGHPLVVDVRRPIMAEGVPPLYFSQPNCQGDAFLDLSSVDPNSALMLTASKAPDGTLRISSSTTGSPHAYASRYRSLTQECVNESATLSSAVPTEVGPNVATLFTPPFSVGPGNVPPLPATERVTLLALLLVVVAIAVVRLRG
jgi:hypothetical protein